MEQGTNEIYYAVNLALTAFMAVFSFLTEIESGRTRLLYRFWHRISPIFSLVWYSIAFALLKAGKEQLWMIVLLPFISLCPLGGAKDEAASSTNHYRPDKVDSFKDNARNHCEMSN